MLMNGTTATQVFPRVFSREELSRIEAPTLLLVGDREKIYRPDEVIAAAKSLMPMIETAIIPDAHHIAALAQPTTVNSHIVRFCSPGKLDDATTVRWKAPESPLELDEVEASVAGRVLPDLDNPGRTTYHPLTLFPINAAVRAVAQSASTNTKTPATRHS
jgi:hypothetical protein